MATRLSDWIEGWLDAQPGDKIAVQVDSCRIGGIEQWRPHPTGWTLDRRRRHDEEEVDVEEVASAWGVEIGQDTDATDAEWREWIRDYWEPRYADEY